jgi:hypothetical protein
MWSDHFDFDAGVYPETLIDWLLLVLFHLENFLKFEAQAGTYLIGQLVRLLLQVVRD